MGAPISDFVIASNTNDILTRFVNDGDMTTRDVVPTLSPSMDIQVSSNFERLLFEMNGRDGGLTAEQLGRFRATGRLDIEGDQRARVHRRARSGPTSFDDDATIAEMRRTQAATGMVLDPHSATGVAAARQFADGDATVVSLATAHPAKFPDAVEAATGSPPRTARSPRRPVRSARAHPDGRQRSRRGGAAGRTTGRPLTLHRTVEAWITCTVLGSSEPHPEFSVVCEFCSGDRLSGRTRLPSSSDTPSLAGSLHMAARREEHRGRCGTRTIDSRIEGQGHPP